MMDFLISVTVILVTGSIFAGVIIVIDNMYPELADKVADKIL